MKAITKQIEVSSCYRIDRRSENMNAAVALHIMRSNEAILYDSATRHEDFTVTLTRHDLICPYCQYTHQLKTHNAITVSDSEVLQQWADPQLNLLEQRTKTITFFQPHECEIFKCYFNENVFDKESNDDFIKMLGIVRNNLQIFA